MIIFKGYEKIREGQFSPVNMLLNIKV